MLILKYPLELIKLYVSFLRLKLAGFSRDIIFNEQKQLKNPLHLRWPGPLKGTLSEIKRKQLPSG